MPPPRKHRWRRRGQLARCAGGDLLEEQLLGSASLFGVRWAGRACMALLMGLCVIRGDVPLCGGVSRHCAGQLGLSLCGGEFADGGLFDLGGDEFHGVFAEVASVGAVPFVVLFDQYVAG